MWFSNPSGCPFRAKRNAGEALLHAVDQRGDAVVAVALHDRIAVADAPGESRLEARLAPARVGFVPGRNVVFGDLAEVGHGLSPLGCDMTFFGRGKRETNYVRGNQKPAG